jgi:hypothetical protein
LEFNTAGDLPDGRWAYYADPNGTTLLSVAQLEGLAETQGMFYASQAWHIAHCTYSWRKLVRATQTGTLLEKRMAGEGHIKHCEEIFRMRAPLGEIKTISGVGLDADAVVKHQGRRGELLKSN